MAPPEPNLYHSPTKSLKPRSGRLFETVDGFPEFAHFACLPLTRESRWRSNLYLFLKVTIQEGILDIQLI